MSATTSTDAGEVEARTEPPASTLDRVREGRRRRARGRGTASVILGILAVVLFFVSLTIGDTVYGLGDVVRVMLGQDVPGANFVVGTLRIPRATLALVAGAAFGMAGVTFQTMLHNALASPDIIGISAGASAAAVFALVVLRLDAAYVSLVAILAALATALLIYLLAYKDGVAGTRLILIGIGISAMLDSVVAYVIIRAASWDLQVAMRWLTGSVNGATWSTVLPLVIAFAVLAPLLLSQSRGLVLMQHGDDAASALGTRVERTRVIAIITAVALIAFATAAAGPIAFVAFLAGPIAARIVGSGGSLMVPAALVGAVLVLGADFAGQYAFGTRYPVGVITGALGAPFLVYLLIRTNRAGGSL
ncbi:ABC-type Fe3+-siderophore transport system, permease 2 component [Serinicoccus hydrothermalis]|uniref:ABC-type Fe3+-siderophore transport system, permease 2 component n=1 Tax=Serinicoccus hydrothermalis TaxID=1758689 RepID=A0A1B1NDZ4_9MICO|nr:iron chelate uptake ABC transporter family permease subunit [Serinicoccus hydrothermalis]ANS79657.1 ABC-type Fe3+-siderophore transport system, permease 2 component [Serinicoccus hydrothermalis]